MSLRWWTWCPEEFSSQSRCDVTCLSSYIILSLSFIHIHTLIHCYPYKSCKCSFLVRLTEFFIGRAKKCFDIWNMRFYIVFTNGVWILVHFVNTRAGGSNCKLSLCCLCIKSLLLVRCQTCGTPSHQHSASHQSFHIYSSGWPPNIITSLSTQSNSAFALFRTCYPVHIPSLSLSLFGIRVHWKLQEDLISCLWDKR